MPISCRSHARTFAGTRSNLLRQNFTGLVLLECSPVTVSGFISVTGLLPRRFLSLQYILLPSHGPVLPFPPLLMQDVSYPRECYAFIGHFRAVRVLWVSGMSQVSVGGALALFLMLTDLTTLLRPLAFYVLQFCARWKAPLSVKILADPLHNNFSAVQIITYAGPTHGSEGGAGSFLCLM